MFKTVGYLSLTQSSSVVVRLTEFLKSVTEVAKDLRRRADDDPEEVLREEALTRESHTVLLLQESLTKVNIVDNILKLRRVNPHHHIHGS